MAIQTIGNMNVSREIGKINANFSSLDLQKITYYANTTSNWSLQNDLISQLDVFYIYTDYDTVDNKDIAGIKIGDGTSYVVDLPFVSVTPTQKNFWNNKVRCFLSPSNSENLIFTTN